MKAEITSENEFPKTLHSAVKYFADPDVALQFAIKMRWPDGVVKCPRCNSLRVSFTAKRRVWTCEDCPKRRQFSIKVGTIMEDSPIPLDKWIVGMWLIMGAKNGISSYELHRALGITQKSAWFLGHRIRTTIQSGSVVKDQLKGIVEVDESWIGGSARNMHKSKKAKVMKGNCNTALTPVQGLLERGTREKCSQVKMQIIRSTKRAELHGNVKKYVLKGTEVQTDALYSYRGLDADYTHKVVDHAVAYVQDGVHTNGLENFWSLLKRSIRGTYVSVEPFHLHRYLDEQVFRFNERKDDDQGRFLKAWAGVFGKRLCYATLTGADTAPLR
jgi:transposase-like protein